MEAEIERLYQIVEDLQNKIEMLEKSNIASNLSLLELEQKVENFKRAFTGAYEL